MIADELDTEILLDATTKGMPMVAAPVRLSDIGRQGWNLLNGDLPLPAATLRADILSANSRWMAEFTRANGLRLAPHGKTTMAPALFRQQIRDGAWAITVATAQQMAVAIAAGVRRIVIANQPIGHNADACFAALARTPDLELHCLVDSDGGLDILAHAAARTPSQRPLDVLVEVGMPGARTGCRTVDAAVALARRVHKTPGLRLSGIEAFEGVLEATQSVRDLLDKLLETARLCDAGGLFDCLDEIVLSAGGSSFFDHVGLAFRDISLSKPVVKVLRSGCYLTHDSFGFTEDFARIVRDRLLPLPEGMLQPALQIWAHVQSRPDADKALLTLGKRDASYDVSLPQATHWYRPGLHAIPVDMPQGHTVTALNDQHAHMQLPPASPLAVGDIVAFGIAHPCTTFDKWQLLMLINADHTVTGAVRTCF